ncbi:MAG: hypothetical protein ABS52_01715 [Gemmatimonadetes bacterium SCN 70-22]|nr:MAG: hypothetical protein ABS52_01715 [Gemmatimonadetes bacterium SCN 70-22]
MSSPAGETYLDALFEASPIGMAVFDSSLRYVRINRALAEMNGVAAAEHIGRTMREVIPELAPTADPILRRALTSSEGIHRIPVSGETRAQPGVERHWIASWLPIEVRGERGVAFFVEERTEQVAAERALRASELRFRGMSEAAPLGIFLTDVDGNVVYSNPAAQRMLGRSAEELQGDGWTRVVHVDDQEALFRRVEEGRASGGTFMFDVRATRADGTLVWGEIVSQVLFDGERPVGRVSLMTDVTERRRMLMALHESEDLFRELSENVDAVFYIARPESSQVDFVSRGFETIWGRSPDELRRNPRIWLDAIHPDDRSRVVEAFERDRTTFRAEYRVVRPDGAMRWISDRSFPVRNAAGEVVRIAGVATDETTRHTLEAQLLQSQRMESIGRLAGGVAHDFNNLLTVILSHAAFARQDPLHADEDLTAVTRAGARAAELTRQLLAFARRQVIEPRVVDLNALTTQTDRMLRRLIGEHVELVTELEPELWPVKVDPAQMEQVLVNLAVNARDALPGGGTVTIETAKVTLDEGYAATHADVAPGDYVMLAVSDNGSGIDPALLPMIFEPFFTTKPSGMGTGLGLATCYGIVRQAGGHIWAYSEPGQGATFKVYLPRAHGVPGEAAPAATMGQVRGDETVLLVEDDASVRAIAARALRAHGFTVLEAGDGVQALEVARGYGGEIHVVVTDVVMPRMGGKELAARLAEERPRTRVLFASGYTRNAIVHQGVLEVGRNFLQKPYVPATLAQKVREVLDAPEAEGSGA